MTTRIYPVSVKPRSQINSWGGWPADVEPVLRSWNGGWPRIGKHSLSFRHNQSGSIFEPWYHVFKCDDCGEFCETHPHGAALLDGDWLCDDCLIARARNSTLTPAR